MTNLHTRRHAVDILFTLALFCVLAASSLLVVMIGVQAYQDITSRMTDNFNTRTSLSYISTKIRQNDRLDAVRLEEFGDGTALVLSETVGETVYETFIYQTGSELRELLINQENSRNPEDGQVIMEISSLSLLQEPSGVIRLTILDRNQLPASLLITPRCASSVKGEAA